MARGRTETAVTGVSQGVSGSRGNFPVATPVRSWTRGVDRVRVSCFLWLGKEGADGVSPLSSVLLPEPRSSVVTTDLCVPRSRTGG